MKGRWKGLIVVAALLLVAAACGDSDDTTDTTAAPTATTQADAPDPTEAPDEPSGNAIQLAVLSDCEGAFGAFHNQDLGGVGAAFAEFAGATISDRDEAAAGFTGAVVAGVPIELVGVGCADDTADAAIRETRRLMEQLGGQIMIGPLSGDESIAVANYAKDHPEQTFINGTAGALDTTMHVQAQNFFRYNGDGAQWNAGTGDFAVNELGWETAAVIMDDYSFGWTSAAGFIAEFCAAGGDVTSRVFPPLNTTDYSSFVAQLPDPDEVDGYFWVVGGAGTIPALKAFEDAKGDLSPEQHMGNLFWEFVTGEFDPVMEGAYVGGFGTAADLAIPSVDAHTQIIASHFDSFPPFEGDAASQAHSGFLVNYFVAAKALIEALEAGGTDLAQRIADGDTSAHQELWGILGSATVEGPYGPITLDSNRQAIVDSYVRRIVAGDDGALGLATVAVIPGVDQSFGGAFTPDIDPPSRDVPTCEARSLPWIGNSTTVVDGVPQG